MDAVLLFLGYVLDVQRTLLNHVLFSQRLTGCWGFNQTDASATVTVQNVAFNHSEALLNPVHGHILISGELRGTNVHANLWGWVHDVTDTIAWVREGTYEVITHPLEQVMVSLYVMDLTSHLDPTRGLTFRIHGTEGLQLITGQCNRLWWVEDGAFTHLLTHLTGAPVDDERILVALEAAVLVSYTFDTQTFRQSSRGFRTGLVWVDKSFHFNFST
ncbi:hypothetical protein D3C72_997750 [compost metagenome]